MKKVLFFVLFCFLSELKAVDIFKPKASTPNAMFVENLLKPKDFNKSNDLTRNVGSFDVTTGELLYLKGKITDAFDIPIANATVQIWQTNSAGKYQNILSKTDLKYDENFKTSGTSKTDNLGLYGFKTIFPGFENADRAPHVNIIITHREYGTIITEVYFEDHKMNARDAIYQSYTDDEKRMLTAKVVYTNQYDLSEGKVATFNIVMDGIHAYKK
ncbi:MAG: hypothetical protein LBT02_00880 [Rickettsiales bacterium]|jgi:protocatechuate 3,4-dioxygenase beta subunit|nr:hypothetical protein [Rickettsiales bacterium]